MDSKLILTGALVASGLLGAVPASAEPETNFRFIQMMGEFEIGNAETKVISHGKTPHVYRVCVSKSRPDVPLKVMFDDKSEVVSPGSCVDVEGVQISVTPASGLARDVVLIGHYRPV